MARRSGLGQEAVRRANMSALLTLVHLQDPTTRAALTTTLGLNRSTIGDLTSQLEDIGLLLEVPPGEESTGAGRRSGRPSLVVAPRQDVTVLAVALDVDRITVAVVALGGVALIALTGVGGTMLGRQQVDAAIVVVEDAHDRELIREGGYREASRNLQFAGIVGVPLLLLAVAAYARAMQRQP